MAPTVPGQRPIGGSAGVSQAGAQDFGAFRQILEAGGLPSSEVLDDLGFFAEHKLDYPTAACGQELCLHGLLGMMGNMIDGSTCTLVQLGMNTPVDVATVERPPLHLVLAVDGSGSMQGDPIAYVREGLSRMVEHLDAGDHVSLVRYSSGATVVLEHVPATEASTLLEAFDGLAATGSTNLFEGMFEAFRLAERHRLGGEETRVVLLSDGVATAGITDTGKLVGLAEGYARAGVGITTIGLGDDFDFEVMLRVAEVGAGNFYFLEDPAAAREVFTEEVKTFLYPIALDVQVDVQVGDAFRIGEVYGTNGWTGTAYEGVVDIPTLFLAGRTDASDPVDGGRRGGGGAIMLELLPLPGAAELAAGSTIGTLVMTFTDPRTGETHTSEQTIQAPGPTPAAGWFTDATVEKGFVMLNLYAGFDLAARLAEDGDYATARVALTALAASVRAWLDGFPGDERDPDIEDDLTYVDMFVANLESVEAGLPVQLPPPGSPPNPWPHD